MVKFVLVRNDSPVIPFVRTNTEMYFDSSSQALDYLYLYMPSPQEYSVYSYRAGDETLELVSGIMP